MPHLPSPAVSALVTSQFGEAACENVMPAMGATAIAHLRQLGFPLPLVLASVVPSQTLLWQAYPQVQVLTLDHIPLGGTYPTLGIDRALALWGVGSTWGWPALSIDAGTSLTFTGATAAASLVGGVGATGATTAISCP